MKCTCGPKRPCPSCLKEYCGPGGLWHELRHDRAKGRGTLRLTALIERLSVERLAARRDDPKRARVLTVLLNGHDHDYEDEMGRSVWSIPWNDLDRETGTPDEEAQKRAEARVQRWRRGDKKDRRKYNKERKAARRTLQDEVRGSLPGLVGLGIVPAWRGDPDAARYPSGFPFGGRDSDARASGAVEPKPIGKREKKRELRRVFIENNPDMSVRQIAAVLGIQDRRSIKRLKDHALIEARAALGDIAPRSDVAKDRAVTRATASDA